MNNQEISDKIAILKESLEQERHDLEVDKKWVAKREATIDALENEILGLGNYLKEEMR